MADDTTEGSPNEDRTADSAAASDRVAPLPTPVLGDANAPVTVTVYGNITCSGCRAFHDNVLPRLERDYIQSSVVRYEHRDYPQATEDEPEMRRSANASRAVQAELGDSAFYDYVDALYANQHRLGLDLYAELADDVGADPDSVRRAAKTRQYAATIERDHATGNERGVGAIPAIFVGDEEFTGTTVHGLTDLIEEQRP